MKKILVLGHEGYLGRALQVYLNKLGFETYGVDNLLRAKAVGKVGGRSVFPIKGREELAGEEMDVCHYGKFKRMVAKFNPDTIIHLAEQPSAPYSHRNNQACVRTLRNNTVSTTNVLWAIKEVNPEIHLIKLGTAGEYPDWLYPEMEIPEGGRIKVDYNGKKDWEIPTPRYFGSFYHSTKFYDSYLLDYANRIWGINSIDINQSPVYGHMYDTRLDVDEYFGTVVNRFIAQAVIECPLTVYGKTGGQTRGYIHLKNALEAIAHYIQNPNTGFRVVHQRAEEKTVLEIAELVKKFIPATIEFIDNPRAENDSNKFSYSNETLDKAGIEMIKMEDVLGELIDIFKENKNRIPTNLMTPKTKWR